MAATAAEEVFAPTAQVAIPGVPMNSWDISWVDPTLGLFFLGDRSHNAVDVVSTGGTPAFQFFIGQGTFTGLKSCASVPPPNPANQPGANDCRGPDGVIVINHNEVWAGDGDSTVKVFNLNGSRTTPTFVIPTGGIYRADEMCFDPVDQIVMVANNSGAEAHGPFATLISARTHTVLANIFFDGTQGTPVATNGAEQCSWSPATGFFYLTLPGVENPDNGHGVVVVINPTILDKKKNVWQVFDIPKANCDTPQGSATGPGFQLLVGCNGSGSTTQSSVIIDVRDGTILATVPNQSGPDEVWFNPGDGHYFLARSAATGPNQLLGVIDAFQLQGDPSVFTAFKTGTPTPAGSHSVAADPVTNRVFVPIGGAGSSNVCGSVGGSDAQGCIAVYSTPNDDTCIAQGAPVVGGGTFLPVTCIENQ
jgi:hypothetical protein